MTQAQVAQLTKALVAALTATPKASKKPVKAKAAKLGKAEFEAALIEAAKKRGYKNPEPRFNILTYKAWVEKGRKVRAGEKSLVVNGRKSWLFHEEQTDPV